MDESDLPFINRYGDDARRVSHSGYDRSLTHGSDTRTYSTMTHDMGDFDAGFFTDVSQNVRRPVEELDPNIIPPCLYMNLRKTPSRYLVGFHDHPVDAMDDVMPRAAAVPFNVPPPRLSHRVSQAPIDQSRSLSILDFDIFLSFVKSVTLKNPIDRSMEVGSANAIISLMSKEIGEILSYYICPILISRTQTSSHLLYGMSKVMTAQLRYMAPNLPLAAKGLQEIACTTLKVLVTTIVVTTRR